MFLTSFEWDDVRDMISQCQNLEVTPGIRVSGKDHDCKEDGSTRGSMSDQLSETRWRGREQIKFYQKMKGKTAILRREKDFYIYCKSLLLYIFFISKDMTKQVDDLSARLWIHVGEISDCCLNFIGKHFVCILQLSINFAIV